MSCVPLALSQHKSQSLRKRFFSIRKKLPKKRELVIPLKTIAPTTKIVTMNQSINTNHQTIERRYTQTMLAFSLVSNFK